jgi:uncharacterized protein (DUF2141 family)
MIPRAPHSDQTLIASNQSAHPNHLGTGGSIDTIRKGLLISTLFVFGLAAAVLIPLKPWVKSSLLPVVQPDLTQAAALPADSKTPQIDVVLKGIANAKGVIRLAAFNKQQGFPTDANSAYRLMMLPAKKGELSVALNDVPMGKFAIVVYHDQNNNNKLDVNILGMPTEHYGVSNNARKRLSAPKFRDAVFSHNEAVTRIEIELR